LPRLSAVNHALDILTKFLFAEPWEHWIAMVGPPKTRSNRGRIVVVLKWVAVSDTVLVLIIEKKKVG
jgi:hypothetical protein